MRKSYQIAVVFILILGLTIISKAMARDLSDNQMGNFIIQIAEKFYKEGRIEEAVHEYNKALTVDPENEKALARLKELGLEKRNYSGWPYEVSYNYLNSGSRKESTPPLANGIKVEVKAVPVSVTVADQSQTKSEVDSNEAIELADLKKQLDEAKQSLEEYKKKVEVQAAIPMPEIKFPPQESIAVINEENPLSEEEQKIVETALNESSTTSSLPSPEIDVPRIEAKLKEVREQARHLAKKEVEFSAQEKARDEINKKEMLIQYLQDLIALKEQRLQDATDEAITKQIEKVRLENQLADKMNELVETHDNVIRYHEKIIAKDSQLYGRQADIAVLQKRLSSSQEKLVLLRKDIDAQTRELELLRNKLQSAKKIAP